jgi:hypothetical protein
MSTEGFAIPSCTKLLNKREENMSNTTNRQRVLAALQTAPRGLTSAQLKARTGAGNPNAEISRLRMDEGYSIYANQRKNSKGQVRTYYRLGTPSRKVIAAGYRAMAQGLV